jgi:hypothetical protein
LLHFLSVLVDAGKKESGISFQPLVPRNDIGQDFFVGMPNVGRRVRVIDRGGEEEGLCHAGDKLPDVSGKRNRLVSQPSAAKIGRFLTMNEVGNLPFQYEVIANDGVNDQRQEARYGSTFGSSLA